MIRAEDVLLFAIKWALVNYFEGQSDKKEKRPRPPAVNDAREFELLPRKHRYEQRKEENNEEYRENDKAVKCVEPLKEFHRL